MTRPAQGPGPLATVHRITIATALAGAVFFAIWELREYLTSGEVSAAVSAALAFSVSAGIALYLRSLRGLGARLSPRDDRERR